MLNRPLNAVLVRLAIVAAALAALLLIAPAATADEADPPCSMVGSTVTCSYDEDGTDPVADFSAMDPEEEGIVWDAEGIDRDAFDITGGVLTFKTSPNFEMPSDVDDPGTAATDESGDNIYEVTVKATEVLTTDQEPPALSSTLTVTVTVNDVDEDGSMSLDRLQPQVGAVLTASFSDPDRGAAGTTNPTNEDWLWSVPKVSRPVTDNDDHWQPAGIDTSITNAAAYTPDAADVGKILRVKVSYNDAQSSTDIKPLYMLSYYVVRAVPAAGTNNDPGFGSETPTSFDVDEDAAVGTVVGTIGGSDLDSGDILSHALTANPGDNFAIDIRSGEITVAAALDYETNSAIVLTVTVYDPSNAAGTLDVTINVGDVNEAPTVAGSATGTIPEINSTPPAGYTYTAFASAAYTATDPDAGDTTTLSLSGDDENLFEIAAGVVTFTAAPDFEDPKDASLNNSYNINVVAEDVDGLTDMLAVTIKVTNVDEDGDVTLSTDQPAIGVPITATVSDPDNGITGEKWQWASTDTAGGTFVDIDGATSATFTPREAVEDTDGNETMASDEGKFLQATVEYRDKASPIEDSASTPNVDESTALNEEFMAAPFYAVRAQPDVNTAPMFAAATIMREVLENETVNAGAPVTATDAEGDSIAYSISGGADMDAFGIVGSGQITVGDDTDLNFESDQTTYEVELTAEDPFGESSSTMVTITVANVNEAPEFVADDPDDYDENGPGPVATFTATDPELAGIDWFVEGNDAADFSIDDNGVLTFNESPDYEAATDRPYDADNSGTISPADEGEGDNEYEIVVRASEVRAEGAQGSTGTTEQDVTVTVKNVDEPGSISLTLLQPQTGVALTASVSDLDGGVTVTSWLWSVPKVNRPEFDNDDHWQPAAVPTNAAAYTAAAGDEGKVLRVKAIYTDGEGADKDEYKLSYHAVRPAPSANNAPTFSATGDYTRSIPEDAAVGTIVGAPVTATDANEDDAGKLTYDLSGADAASFNIDKMTGQITVAAALDHERSAGATYTVAVGVLDPSVNDVTTPFDTAVVVREVVTITATDVNEAPTVTGATVVSSVDENVPALTTSLGTFTATDLDDGDTTELSLSGDDSDAFELSATGVLTFKASPNYESSADTNGDNAYRVTVVATDGDGLTDEEALTIKVLNVDEPGEVILSNSFQPTIGRPMVAILTDDDGGVNGAEWQWQSSTTETGTYTDIDGATSDTYTPKEAVDDNEATEVDESAPSDEGLFLRATVTYRDAQSIDDDPSSPAEEGRRAAIMATSVNAVREKPATNADPAFPASVTREVEENTAAGENVGDAVEATDADGDALTYSLSGGADMESFLIDRDTGQITVGADTVLNYESDQRTYMVEVTATDTFGGVGSTMVTIMVTNVNEAPELELGGGENVAPVFADDTATFMVDENMDAGAAVGTVTADDPGDTLTYSDDSDYFDVDNMGNITTAVMLDYEAMSSHMVTVTATDVDGESDSIDVTVTVGNVEECEDAGAIAADTTNVGQMADCEALLASRDALMGAGATRMLNWSADTPIAEWYGVRKLSDSGRVEWLYLHGVSARDATDDAPARAEMKLNGTIPAELGDLTELTRLYLHRNNLTGGIPEELNGLTNLVWLRVYDNMLTGVVPDLSDMTSLERVYIHENQLTGGVPTGLSDSVTHLLVHRNELDGPIPDLSSLTNLEWLGLYDNDLSGEIPGTLGTLGSLERLYLHGNNLTGMVPMEIGGLAALTNLWVKNNSLSGDLPSSLGNLGNLERVRISGNSFTGCVPAALTASDSTTSDADLLGLPTCGGGS